MQWPPLNCEERGGFQKQRVTHSIIILSREKLKEGTEAEEKIQGTWTASYFKSLDIVVPILELQAKETFWD